MHGATHTGSHNVGVGTDCVAASPSDGHADPLNGDGRKHRAHLIAMLMASIRPTTDVPIASPCDAMLL